MSTPSKIHIVQNSLGGSESSFRATVATLHRCSTGVTLSRLCNLATHSYSNWYAADIISDVGLQNDPHQARLYLERSIRILINYFIRNLFQRTEISVERRV